ncbi:S-adenosyl-L-methionine-dependent methyltransferase [Aspergillus spectabilis]
MSTPTSPPPPPLDFLKSNIQKAYNSISPRYTKWTNPQHPTRLKYLNILLPELTSNANPSSESEDRTVLEVGCGTGDPVIRLLASSTNPKSGDRLFTQIIGNDLSTAHIKIASESFSSYDNISFQEGDMMALSFPAQSLLTVVGMYSLIHLPRDEQVTFLERVYTWLKPGGYLLANFGVQEIEGNYNKGWLGGEEGEMFWSSWGEEKTCEVLEGTGFELVVREVFVDVEGGEDGEERREVPFLWVLGRKINRHYIEKVDRNIIC